jgi:3D (Asp-Asp-Asp) domain-containing protein
MSLRARRIVSRALALRAASLVVPASASALTASGSPGGAGLPGGGGGSSGGAPLGGLAPTGPPHKIPPPPSKHARGRWLGGVTITEYWPAPERWFQGRLVRAPGLPGTYPIDWLYSATGISMEGEGLGLNGSLYHIASLGDGGWVTQAGVPTSPSDGWAAGPPYWRAGGYWTDRSGGVTFPLRKRGRWSAGRGLRYVPLPGVSFARGPSLPLRFYQSIAVDPSVIPLGSRVYIPAYRRDGHGGWFIAQDTGGAISGAHVDVYRTPPASPADSGQDLTGQRVFVVAPRH